MTPKIWDSDRSFHDTFFASENPNNTANNVHVEEIRTTPLFSADVLADTLKQKAEPEIQVPAVLPQYGLVAKVLETFDDAGEHKRHREDIVDAYGTQSSQRTTVCSST